MYFLSQVFKKNLQQGNLIDLWFLLLLSTRNSTLHLLQAQTVTSLGSISRRGTVLAARPWLRTSPLLSPQIRNRLASPTFLKKSLLQRADFGSAKLVRDSFIQFVPKRAGTQTLTRGAMVRKKASREQYQFTHSAWSTTLYLPLFQQISFLPIGPAFLAWPLAMSVFIAKELIRLGQTLDSNLLRADTVTAKVLSFASLELWL